MAMALRPPLVISPINRVLVGAVVSLFTFSLVRLTNVVLQVRFNLHTSNNLYICPVESHRPYKQEEIRYRYMGESKKPHYLSISFIYQPGIKISPSTRTTI